MTDDEVNVRKRLPSGKFCEIMDGECRIFDKQLSRQEAIDLIGGLTRWLAGVYGTPKEPEISYGPLVQPEIIVYPLTSEDPNR